MPQPWDLPERDVTPESAALDRRGMLKWIGLGALAVGSGAGLWWWRHRGTNAQVLGTGHAEGKFTAFYPATRNSAYPIDRLQTGEAEVGRYCNFYEFSFGKDVWRYVEPFQPVPWRL